MAEIPDWRLQVDYIETCNCIYGCPCNFAGYPTDGFCEALVGYHINSGKFGPARLDGLDVIYAAAWPKAIHQGGGSLRLYISEQASSDQRDGLVQIFSGRAQGNGPFELFGSTMVDHQEPVFCKIEMSIDGRRSAFHVPGVLDVEVEPFVDPVSGEQQDVEVHLPNGFIWKSVQAAKTRAMRLFGTGPLSFDHTGQNAFFTSNLEFSGP